MRLIRTIGLIYLLGLVPAESFAQSIVWTDSNGRRIQRKDANGGEITTIVQFPSSPSTIHYDPTSTKLYYRLHGIAPVFFQRVHLDGSNIENLPTPSGGNFTLNIDSRKFYWVSPGNGVNRSELDGSGVVSHAYAACCVLTIEAFGNDLFFGAGLTLEKGIWRTEADGSNEQFLRETGQPTDLAHDPVENKLYVAAINGIFRMNPDASAFEMVIERPFGVLGVPTQVAVDSDGRKLYWAAGDIEIIRRSNLDGSDVEDFVTAADTGNPNFNIGGLTIAYGDAVTGACCQGDPFAPCTDNKTLSDCQCPTCAWHKLRGCDEVACPRTNAIPTVSSWGFALLTLLLLIAAKIVFARHPHVVARPPPAGIP